MYDQVIFDKDAKTVQWKKIVFSANGIGKTGYSHVKS